MSCPTCDHTMHGLGDQWFWCPRCGTILNRLDREHTTSIPKAVEQVRNWLHNPTYISIRHLLTPMVLRPDERESSNE